MFWKKNKKTTFEEKDKDESVTMNLVQRTYGVELYFETEIETIPVEELLQKLQQKFENVDIVGDQENTKLILFKDKQVEYANGKVPSQIALLKTSNKPDLEKLESVFSQSWEFSNVKEVVSNCNSSILVTDMMSSGLDYKDRMQHFLTTLRSLIEIVDCKAIYWQPSQQFVRPESIMDNNLESEQFNPIHGIVNVRLFNISGSNNELLMDTLGLSALGLLDFEIVFSEINVQKVANLLYSYARYIFENGNVIKEGNTIEGIELDSKLQCRIGESLISPKRFVVNLDVN